MILGIVQHISVSDIPVEHSQITVYEAFLHFHVYDVDQVAWSVTYCHCLQVNFVVPQTSFVTQELPSHILPLGQVALHDWVSQL